MLPVAPSSDGSPSDGAPAPAAGRRRGFTSGFALGLLVGLGIGAAALLGRSADRVPAIAQVGAPTTSPSLVVDVAAPDWSLDSYADVGAWVDVFDYAPAYRRAPAPDPAVEVAAMRAAGVRTLFLQGARLDERSPDGLTDPWWLTAWLLAAHREGLDVVGWYLPKHDDPAADLERVRLLRDFRALGHGVDGLTVDIEWTEGVPDPVERSAVLVDWSAQVRALVGDDPVGAAVIPPVQLEVINEQYWPGFPWRDLVEDYDVWLPMAYASYRTEASGYRDQRRYSTESIQRLRANLGRPDAAVHPIGGLAEEIRPGDLEGLAESVRETGALGASVYDWTSMRAEDRPRLAELLDVG